MRVWKDSCKLDLLKRPALQSAGSGSLGLDVFVLEP